MAETDTKRKGCQRKRDRERVSEREMERQRERERETKRERERERCRDLGNLTRINIVITSLCELD